MHIVLYNTVMNAWARSGDQGAAPRAQSLFDKILHKYDDGDRKLKPGLSSFRMLVTAWIKLATSRNVSFTYHRIDKPSFFKHQHITG